jgi:hypothetical protein
MAGSTGKKLNLQHIDNRLFVKPLRLGELLRSRGDSDPIMLSVTDLAQITRPCRVEFWFDPVIFVRQ